jgi:hypothetical protein
MENIHVTYDYEYPALSQGTWNITIDDKKISIKEKPMDTHGVYEVWSFPEEYEDGLKIDEWVKTPPKHLIDALKDAEIEATENLLRRLYEKIQPLDWRHLSCGACI